MHTHLASAGPTPAVTLVPGFADPQAGAQQTFRAALSALAEPGSIRTIDAECGAPPGLSPAQAALLLALADADTPVWLAPGADPAIRPFLAFHCGCPPAATPAGARFVVVPAGCAMPALADCDPGDPAYPDRSSTVLLEAASLSSGDAAVLSGPGIESRTPLAAAGLPAGFWEQWRENHRRFPLGVDVLLTCGSRIAGLPRTTLVES